MDAPDDLPVVICGMAGSRTGWIEAPYMSLPAGLTSIVAAAVRVPARRHVLMLPGVARRSEDAPDVMRGEETKLLGLVHRGTRDAVVVMPGTHAKWVHIADGKLSDYRSFMTGELFALLKDKSVLAGALEGLGRLIRQALLLPRVSKLRLRHRSLSPTRSLRCVLAGWCMTISLPISLHVCRVC